MAATSQQQRVVIALGRLAFAYGALLSQGDAARAAIVLRKYQSLYNANVEALKNVMRDAGADGSWGLPSMVPLPFDARMRKAMVPSLVFLMGRRGEDSARAQTAALEMPETQGLVGRWWAESMGILRPYFGDMWPQYSAYYDLAARTDVGSLPAALDQVVDAELAAGGSTATPPSTPTSTPQPTIPDAIRQLNPVHIVGRRYAGLPLWGWIGIVGGVTVAGGVLIYGASKRAKRRRR